VRWIVAIIAGLVVLAVVALSWDPGTTTTWERPLVADDGRSVELQVQVLRCGREFDIESVDVDADDEAVTVTAHLAGGFRPFGRFGACRQPALLRTTTVEFDEPLGDRELLDGGCRGGPCSRNPRVGSSEA
jgi:hypothetical protein